MEPPGENPKREQYFSSRFDVLREGQSSEEGVNEESHINHIFISSASWMDWIGSASYFSIPSYLFPPTQPSPFIISIPSYIYLLRRRQGRSAWMGRQRMNLHLILICQSWRRNKARETVVLIYRGLVFDTNFFQVFAPEVVSAVQSWWPRWQSPSSFLEGRCFFLTSGSIKRCRTKNLNILRIENPDIHLGNVHVKEKISVCWHF